MTAAGKSARDKYAQGLATWRARRRRWLPVTLSVTAIAALVVGGLIERSVPGLGWLAGLATAVVLLVQLLRVPQSVQAWRQGAVGEERTARLLAPLTRRGFVVLHDLRVPRSRANIDHLVIGPTGVYVVDTKNYRGRVTLRRRTLWYGSRPLTRTLDSIHWQASRLTAALGQDLVDAGVTIRPVLCLHAPQAPRRRRPLHGVLIVPGSALRRRLRAGPRVLDSDCIDRLASRAAHLAR